MEEFWKRVSEDKGRIRFLQAGTYSPYSEFSRNGIREGAEVDWLTLNAYYRYDKIMEPLFANKETSKAHKDWLFDIYMHYLTELEYRTGATILEFKIRSIQKELENGSYGKDVRSAYMLLDKERKYMVAHMLQRQEASRESVDIFAEIIIAIMQDGIVYKNKNEEKELLFYINKAENEKDKLLIEMLCELFMPIGYELRVFRENHFAVLGENQTMIVNEIELI